MSGIATSGAQGSSLSGRCLALFLIPAVSGCLILATPRGSLSQNIHVHDLRILAPMDRIGNTDGCNLDSCRNALVENLFIANSDDGVCMKAGLDGFGMNLAVPTENVLVRNITTSKGFRGGFAIGSEMSGGVRNVTYRDSRLLGERGINIKPSVGRGGYIQDVGTRSVSL